MKQLAALQLLFIPVFCYGQPGNYLEYHIEVTKAEEHIASRQFDKSLKIYRTLVDKYDHVFLRDIKVAAQLAAYSSDTNNLFYFLEKGLKKGWPLKEIKKMKIYGKFKNEDRWKKLKAREGEFSKEFEGSVNLTLRSELKEMLKEDQKRALRVALTPVKKWRDSYTRRKFVPNNRAQVRRIDRIIDDFGYPGEKLIGDRSWATVIISHNEHDTLYSQLRPKLYSAFERGELSAIELAMIETWRTAVDTERKEKGFIIWAEEISRPEAIKGDSLRQSIGLRSIELNNKLIQMEKDLDMNFYLAPFHGGTITIRE